MSTTPTKQQEDGLDVSWTPFEGLIGDIKRRIPHYGDDITKGFHPKVLASILFLFFACLANAVAFGGLTGLVTNGEIGTVEMIVATGVGGVLFAIFSGQPLTILGGTGPIVIFTGLLYKTCETADIPFLPTYAWVGIWSGVFMIALSITNASVLMRYFTRFTDEIFAALIAVIFIVEAVEATIHPFLDDHAESDTALLTLVLAIGTFGFAYFLKQAKGTPYTTRRIREAISDFGPAIAIGLMTAFALYQSHVVVDGPAMPDQLQTTSGREWMVDLWILPTWAIFASIIPALMATILLFLDQNITTRLVNAPSHKLNKGAGFHLDLLVVGIITAACSVFGLPWIVAATVHALNHVQSLADTELVETNGQKREVISAVREQRVSAFVIHALIIASIFLIPLIKLIPMAVLFGLFLFMGVATLQGNQFAERVMLWVTDSRLYPDAHYVRKVPFWTIHKFTMIQVVALGALWFLKTSPAGILFPILIAMLVPLRLAMKSWFDPEHLEALDAEESAEEVEAEGMMGADLHA
ncbi:MAG: HCO3- transporter [Rhodobacterales bacterium]|nr:HCO3- transporter [Rhodobacterales bacterium]